MSNLLNSIDDIRQIESILHQISSKSVTGYSGSSQSFHIPHSKHIEMAVNNLAHT